ncbi:hypothetical protein Unana1_03635 [Umbelopsis nana]
MNRGPGGVYAVPGLKNANSVKECEECGKSFSIFRPKNHCRNCGSVVCNNCSENKNELPKFGYTNPVRCCDTCHEMIQMQRMGTQALLEQPMKKLKFYLSAYQLPSRGALEKQDLVRIIISSHPLSNSSEMHYRNVKAKTLKTSRQDSSLQSENGPSFSGFVNGLVDGIGDIFRDDEEPLRRQEDERRRQQQQSRRQPQPSQHQQQQQQQRQQPIPSRQPARPNPQQNYTRPYNDPTTNTTPQPSQPSAVQRQQPPVPPQHRPPPSTTTPPRPSNSPDDFQPPSLDTLIQAKIDPNTLSVRTLKSVLKANFVEHSKVLEKSELVTRVNRLLDDRRKESQRTDDRGLEDEGLCRICCDASQNCVFLECGHMVTCMDCGKKLVASRNECPICRERIIKLVHVFRS